MLCKLCIAIDTTTFSWTFFACLKEWQRVRCRKCHRKHKKRCCSLICFCVFLIFHMNADSDMIWMLIHELINQIAAYARFPSTNGAPALRFTSLRWRFLFSPRIPHMRCLILRGHWAWLSWKFILQFFYRTKTRRFFATVVLRMLFIYAIRDTHTKLMDTKIVIGICISYQCKKMLIFHPGQKLDEQQK